MAACEKYRQQFDQYFDNELKESRRRKLQAHIDSCARCRFEFKLYEKVIIGVESLESVAPPPDLTAEVMRGIKTASWPWHAGVHDTSGGIAWGWAVAFAAVLMLTMASFLAPVADQTHVAGRLKPRIDETVVDHGLVTDELSSGPRGTQAVPTGITLVRHVGRVEVMPLAGDDWQEVAGQFQLSFGDRVRTSDDGVAGIEYQAERVALRLKPGSLVQLVSGQALRVFAGNTWIKVSRKGTEFSAETPNAVASVRGTKLSVEVVPLTDAYRDHGHKTLMHWTAPERAPRATTDLIRYSTQVGLDLMKEMAGLDAWPRIETHVNVYESRVRVASRGRDGREVEVRHLEEGFGTRVMLARVEPEHVLGEDDFAKWRSVMVYDPALIDRARRRLPMIPLPQAAPPPTTIADPAAESDRPAGMFDDIRTRER